MNRPRNLNEMTSVQSIPVLHRVLAGLEPQEALGGGFPKPEPPPRCALSLEIQNQDLIRSELLWQGSLSVMSSLSKAL